jgi:AraC-like DNA-binding protein
MAACGMLSADAMMLRNLLWARLQRSEADEFESEALGLDLLSMSLGSMCPRIPPPRTSALEHRRRAVELVKEAVGAAPADKWGVGSLAKVASLSPFHLCRIFREMVGTSIYDYVLQERLAHSLDAVLDGGSDLTAIALEAGFASHSHFTARFLLHRGGLAPPTPCRSPGAHATDPIAVQVASGLQCVTLSPMVRIVATCRFPYGARNCLANSKTKRMVISRAWVGPGAVYVLRRQPIGVQTRSRPIALHLRTTTL